ncbi:MAG TPA: lysylphosphatidylglycerol synthase transmembrane domain-containing protein [Polyangiaceae bacterium]|nr:lysylphosphatidylglycerol synthase transmembrane domain-containing protein [Polyangiaceae bacterium]
MRRTRLLRNGARAGVILAMVVAFVMALRDASPREIFRVFGSANLEMLSVFVPVILAVGFALRAARFGVLLGDQPGSGVRYRDVLGSILVSQAANNVLPLRAGEFVRTRDFVVRGYPLEKVAAAQIMEKLVEVATLLVWVVWVAWVAPVLGRTFLLGVLRRPFLASAVLVVLAMAVGAWAWTRLRRSTFNYRQSSSIVGLATATGWSLLADGLEVALIYVCLRSLGISGGLQASLTVLAAVNLAIALPSTPGNVGVLEAGAALGLIAVGVPRESAIAFALLYRFVQWLPVTLAGAAVWWVRRPPQERRATSSSTTELSLGKARS